MIKDQTITGRKKGKIFDGKVWKENGEIQSADFNSQYFIVDAVCSLRKIASRAEVTTGTLYTRYKNKDELFEYRLLQYCLLVCFDKKQSRILQQIGNILHIACEPCK